MAAGMKRDSIGTLVRGARRSLGIGNQLRDQSALNVRDFVSKTNNAV
jgi:hypothetical protein